VRILLLGGTGLIGSAVLSELRRRGHSVLALARSAASAQKATTLGADVIGGDIETPEAWVRGLHAVDAVIHAACDFASRMGEVDRHLLDVLLAHLGSQPKRARFIYTGGNWLFGATGDVVATEQSDSAPLAAFAWMVPHSRRILDSVEVEGIVIHPAMVYDGGDGVFRRFARAAIERTAIRVVSAESVRWPLVHRSDLAMLYALALERASAGSSYIGAAVEGVPVGRIARAFARRYGSGRLDPEIISADAIAAECGEWARGYALDQQLSGAKARPELGWRPSHLDPEREIASLPA
jgi:nucleoside-diphosphate-sugar epimerase